MAKICLSHGGKGLDFPMVNALIVVFGKMKRKDN
jgi:hypothetical protein